jgi:hypothetical protein
VSENIGAEGCPNCEALEEELSRVGLLAPDTLPVAGSESARKMLDPTSVPSSELLIERAKRGKSG